MNTKSNLYYADCYDKMAKKDLAIYGVCNGKIQNIGSEQYIYQDCIDCPYWACAIAVKAVQAEKCIKELENG